MMKELKPKLKLLTVPESTFINSLPKLDLVSLSFDEQSENRLAMLVGKIEEMQTQRYSAMFRITINRSMLIKCL